MRQLADGTRIFLRPEGSVLDAAPALPTVFTSLKPASRELDDSPVWDGTPFDVVYAIDALYKPRAGSMLVS